MSSLKGKVAVVTGAGRRSGIGAAIARRLAEEGATLVVGDLCTGVDSSLPNPGAGQWLELQEVAEEIAAYGAGCLPLQVDVTDEAAVASLVAQTMEAFGRLDILVNNAGAIFGPSPIAQMAAEAWRGTLEVNATGTFLCTRAALPAMIGGGRGGRIVNIASLAAQRPRPYMAAYAASKAAVVAMTQSLAQEVAPYGITANALLPGDIDTAMKQWGYRIEAMVAERSYEEVVAAGVARIPAGRLGTPADVAAMVAFLASDQAAFITGQALAVTGGRELG